MTSFLPIMGYVGTGIVIGAYVPQIWHLWSEHCSAGISERAYALWTLSSGLFLAHSIIIGDPVFMITQLVNIVALTIILVLARRFRKQICAVHARQLTLTVGLNEAGAGTVQSAVERQHQLTSPHNA